jgi:protein-tyrosine phosphatase
MVCLGNICRSPLAQGILEHKVKIHGLVWEVDSAGTSAYHIGDRPDQRSISKAKEYHIDLSTQRARQLLKQDLEDYDIILAMDASNYRDIISLSEKKHRDKIKLVLNYVYPGQNRQVPDPYYTGSFQEVYDLLDQAMDRMIELES